MYGEMQERCMGDGLDMVEEKEESFYRYENSKMF